MATDTLIPVVQYLYRVTAPPKAVGPTDGELLERFAGQRDQAAFAALVQRHGPMVMGVCRRLLRDRHEAEDAWQATFLILVRKAGAIARRELLAGWLYGVAYRTARRARCVAARRQTRERPAGDVVAPAPVPAEAWSDLRPILDEEIQRLPEKYRLPVILCYFENKTNTEAARLLNCPRGTIATRLARARERLRVRLTRRGVTLSAGGLALALSQEATPAAVPGMLAAATVRAGWLLAAGAPAAGGMAVQVTLLAQGVMRMMAMTKLKAAMALILVAGVVGSGSGLVALPMCASENALEQPASTREGKAPRPAVPATKPERANGAQMDQHVDKPRGDAAINLLGFPVSLSLMGERLNPPGRISLSCDDFIINHDRSIALHGAVRATQGTTRLECDAFQVLLDQPIKTITGLGQHGWKECRCDKNVCLEDRVREGGRLVHYTRLVAPAMTIGGTSTEREVSVERRNGHTYRVTVGGEAGGVRAAGPGTFHDLHQGPAQRAVARQTLILWRISYKRRVDISSKQRHVHFEDHVEVVCLPSDEPDPMIDRDQLPEGGIAFRGGNVTFLGQKSAKRQAGRQLVIRDKAVLQNAELHGEADNILYDEDTGRVTLQADGIRPAVLIRTKNDGTIPIRITGQKIIYSLKTQVVDVEKNGGASASP